MMGNSRTTSQPLAYSLQQAAAVSSLSVRKLSEDIRRGALRSFRKGGRRVVLRADLLKYLKG